MSLDKIKVLFVHHGSGIGGASLSLLKLIKNLDTTKFYCKVAFIQKSNVIELFKNENIEYRLVDKYKKYWNHDQVGFIHFWQFHKYFKIYFHWLVNAYIIAPRIYIEENPNIVHLNSYVLSSWAFAAKKNNFNVVCHVRETFSEGYFGLRAKLLRKILYDSVDQFISISINNANKLNLLNKTKVIYNFIEIPEQNSTEFNFNERNFTVLFLGGMEKDKGFFTVTNSLKLLDKNVTVQFAGSMSDSFRKTDIRSRTKKLLKRILMHKNFKALSVIHKSTGTEVIGLVPNINQCLKQCHVLITPFTVSHFSRPAIEAFANAKPVIGSDVEGMGEIIDHNINGLIIEKNNPKALANAINYLNRNRGVAEQMGMKGYEKALRLFSPDNAKKVEQIYEDLILK